MKNKINYTVKERLFPFFQKEESIAIIPVSAWLAELCTMLPCKETASSSKFW